MVLRYNKGFSLIELMIIIAIIGVLASIAVTQFSLYRKRAYNSSALADLRSAAAAQEAYHVDNKMYAGLSASLGPNYGYASSDGVILTVSGDQNSYTIISNHPLGDKTYRLTGPGGTVESN